jgi:hypothetical protein
MFELILIVAFFTFVCASNRNDVQEAVKFGAIVGAVPAFIALLFSGVVIGVLVLAAAVGGAALAAYLPAENPVKKYFDLSRK